MKKLFALVLVFSSQSLAAQQVVSVQSGEHDGFSRLVLNINPAVEWSIEESRGRVVVSFPGRSLNFTTAQVFERISTDRVAKIEGATGDEVSSLELGLNCACDVQSFAYIGRYIVIDVFDGPELEPAEVAEHEPLWRPDSLPHIQPPFVQPTFLAQVMSEAPLQPVLLPDQPPVEESIEADNVQMVETLSPPSDHDVVSNMEAMASETISSMNATVDVQDDPEMMVRIAEAQNQLLAQLTRAADQGLVEFVLPPIAVAEIEASEIVKEPIPDPPEPDTGLLNQLSARTAYSQTTEDALSDIVNQFAMPQCLDDQDFLMTNWSGENDFSTELAALRLALLGEFDAPDIAITGAIIRLYLNYGFGAEAQLFLSESDEPIPNAEIYFDMASILERDLHNLAGPVVNGAGCGGAHEMWFLAAGLGDYQVIEPLAITDVFSSFPVEVRTQIGPPLAEAFIERGQVSAGHVVLEIVRRADGEITSAQRMAEALVLEENGNNAGAEDIYRAVAGSQDDLAPDAMVSFARLRLLSEQPVPASLLIDLESAAFLNRHEARGDTIRIWEIRARAAIEGSQKALLQITENMDERPHLHADLQGLTAEIFEHSSAHDIGDYQYAQMVLQFSGLLSLDESADMARLQIAREMAAIGLPETTQEILAPNHLHHDQEAKILMANAHVQLFEPEAALEMLIGDASFEAYKTKIAANLQLGNYREVAALLQEDFAKNVAFNDIALRAGDWERITEVSALGTLASFMTRVPFEGVVETPMAPQDGFLTPMTGDEEPSLKAARDLLAVNQASRRFLETVLAEPETENQ